jgi:hypothetical protein
MLLCPSNGKSSAIDHEEQAIIHGGSRDGGREQWLLSKAGRSTIVWMDPPLGVKKRIAPVSSGKSCESLFFA